MRAIMGLTRCGDGRELLCAGLHSEGDPNSAVRESGATGAVGVGEPGPSGAQNHVAPLCDQCGKLSSTASPSVSS